MADCNTCNGTYLSVEDLIRRSVRCNSEGKVAFVGTELNVLPSYSTALFWLQGTAEIEGTSYFVDKIDGKLFPITNPDFTLGAASGFPYKSAATFSAPIADAILIAADVNNYLYAGDGTPNQIPVVSLFQDVDYEHKLFCKHSAQVVDINGVETSEPKVTDIVLYSDALATTDLTKAQAFYGVPVEDTTTSVWISPLGNDSTGDGSKVNPYLTLPRIVAHTTTVNAYLKTGDYSVLSSNAFNPSATALNIIGLGRVKLLTYQGTSGITFNSRAAKLSHIDMTWTGSTYGINATGNLIHLDKCKVTKDATNYGMLPNAANMAVKITDCILNQAAAVSFAFFNATSYGAFEFKGNYGNVGLLTTALKPLASADIRYNKLTNGSITVTACDNLKFNSNNVTAPNTKVAVHISIPDNGNKTGIEFNRNEINGNLAAGYLVYIGSSTGEGGVNAINGSITTLNKITNNSIADGTTHTLFVGGGIDNVVKYNYIKAPNGYGIVVKAGGGHYITTAPHVSYNVIDFVGNYDIINGIYGRGAFGLIVANNTLINFRGRIPFKTDDNAVAQDNSMLCVNNIVTLSADAWQLSDGVNMTARKNSVNKNSKAFTTGQLSGTNIETAATLTANGTPSIKVENAEETEGITGLANNYSLPLAPTYQNQAATWQNGAVILP